MWDYVCASKPYRLVSYVLPRHLREEDTTLLDCARSIQHFSSFGDMVTAACAKRARGACALRGFKHTGDGWHLMGMLS